MSSPRSHLAGRLSAFRNLDAHTKVLCVVAILVFGGLSAALPGRFLTVANIESMGFQASELGILTAAMMLAMLIGGIDLSIVATANLSAIVAALILVNAPGPGAAGFQVAGATALSFLAAAAIGCACGMFNGFMIGVAGVPAILATLGTMTLYTGLGFAVTKGHAVHGIPAGVLYLGTGKLMGVPMPLVVFAGIVALLSVALNRTSFGFKMYMLGSNPVAARFSGMDNAALVMKTHVLAGLLAATAGVITLARTNSANPEYGSSYLLMTILIAVLGGVAVTGGFGRLPGVVLALATLQMLSTGLNMLLLRYSGGNFFRDFAWGLLLLFVMVVSKIIKRR
jgi:simple sugar transport system permease protein